MTELNLLYSDLTKQNGKEVLPSTHFMDFKNLVIHYLNEYDDNKQFNVNRYDIRKLKYYTDVFTKTPINLKKKYFYGICPGNIALDALSKFNFGIPDDCLNLIKNNENFFIIISIEHEPITRDGVVAITDKCKELGLENKLICLTNNVYTKELFETIGDNVVIGNKINFLDWSSNHIFKQLEIGNVEKNKKGKLFLFRNRNAKPHRLSLIYKKKKKGYMDDINYSYIPEFFPNNPNSLDDMKLVYSLVLDDEEIKENFKEISEIYQTIKIDDLEEEYKVIGEGNIFQNAHIQNKDLFLVPEIPISFQSSYLNIVTESFYDSKGTQQQNFKSIIHPTEKSFRPYVYYQMPLFVATPNHVKYLRETYNFDMFDDIIDHSYDDEFDDKKRLKLIIDEIGRLIENKDRIQEFYKNNINRVIINREIFFKVSQELKEKDVSFLKKIC